MFRQLQCAGGWHRYTCGTGPQRRGNCTSRIRLLRNAAAGAGSHRRCRATARARWPLSMKEWIDKGYDVIALVPSCALMLKSEWPLILPDDPDGQACRAPPSISANTLWISRRKRAWRLGWRPVPTAMTVHMACHARAQNIGQKAAKMLRLVPRASVKVIERCSGHGGSWGFKKEFFEVGMKIGRPVARQAAQSGRGLRDVGMPAGRGAYPAGDRASWWQ